MFVEGISIFCNLFIAIHCCFKCSSWSFLSLEETPCRKYYDTILSPGQIYIWLSYSWWEYQLHYFFRNKIFKENSSLHTWLHILRFSGFLLHKEHTLLQLFNFLCYYLTVNNGYIGFHHLSFYKRWHIFNFSSKRKESSLRKWHVRKQVYVACIWSEPIVSITHQWTKHASDKTTSDVSVTSGCLFLLYVSLPIVNF